jgi:hypothetical protein
MFGGNSMRKVYVWFWVAVLVLLSFCIVMEHRAVVQRSEEVERRAVELNSAILQYNEDRELLDKHWEAHHESTINRITQGESPEELLFEIPEDFESFEEWGLITEDYSCGN